MHPAMKFYHKMRKTDFEEIKSFIKPDAIVFLGDSNTEFFRVNEFFPEYYVLNRGIGGDTTEGVLDRMHESVYDINPQKVFLMIGTNDLGDKVPVKKILENTRIIIRGIQEHCPKTKIYLESVYPITRIKNDIVKRLIVGKRRNCDIKELNQGLEILAKSLGIPYIDVYSHLIDEEENLRLEYTREGLHITMLGYSVIADVLRPYIEE